MSAPDAGLGAPTGSPADLVIMGATVLVHDASGAVSFADDQIIVIRDGAFASVTDARDSSGALVTPPSARETIDAAGMVAMPGFINCHTHTPMVMFRGAAEDIEPERWFNEFIWPMEVNLTDDDVELATRLAAAEMIRSGVTTFADHYFTMDRIAKVTDETGLRAVLGSTYFSSDGEAGLERSLEFATRWNGAAGGRITTALAPHAPYTVSDHDLSRTAAAAQEHDLLVHIHASEGRSQTIHSRERHGATPIGVLQRTGLLDGRLLIAHGIGIVPEDIPLLAPMAAEGRVGVGSGPKGYLKNGLETTPVRLLRSGGIPVGLATDGAASNNTLDVWESMTFMALVQKAVENDNSWLTSGELLEHATTQSAAAVQLGSSVGRIAAGYRADLVLVDLSEPRVQPVLDLANTLVYSARSNDIDTTIVDGRVLMRGKRVLTVDVPQVVAELQPRLARLTDRSHGRSIQNYDA
ncbi:MAG: amidohydrolase [Herbiconiux sp.]|uniref:amidohydrolase n=1 Tax=Herbiconiux sp. TaxID=1871186 RepID=UPI001214CA9C|nr:amidohydrolase [Herbiconiux sp.]TAJ49530.1 MAG: amidohydrolase [Herbiconiux sp.]